MNSKRRKRKRKHSARHSIRPQESEGEHRLKESETKMDALKSTQTYLVKMLTEVKGMKVLLMDAHTVRIIPSGC